MSSSRLVWVGGLAAMVGGLMWIIKGLSILLTGDQPPVVFEASMPLFAVGVVGLGARLGELRGPLGTAGMGVACVAAASAVVALLTELAAFMAIAGFGPFVGLVLVGSATLQARTSRSPWNTLPLAVGLGGPVLILAGGGLALISERLLEVPIVAIGVAWVLLGYPLLSERNVTFREARPR